MHESTTVDNAPCEGADVVRRFYDALAGGDPETLRAVVSEHFAEDVELALPPSLPYGGIHRGAGRLARMFAGMAGGGGAGPGALRVVDIVDDTDRVVARVRFEWGAAASREPIAHEALEMWTFVDGLVTEIRGFYWDTHACVELTQGPRRADATEP